MWKFFFHKPNFLSLCGLQTHRIFVTWEEDRGGGRAATDSHHAFKGWHEFWIRMFMGLWLAVGSPDQSGRDISTLSKAHQDIAHIWRHKKGGQ